MRIGVLTLSDRSARGEREDRSGPRIVAILQSQGWSVERQEVIPDDQPGIEATLTAWSDSSDLDVILTTGGTGFSARDRAPEATHNVCDRMAPGLAEAMRTASMKITPHAMLSRAAAGIRGATLIVNLPGSPRAASENLEVILAALPHAVQLLNEDPQSEGGHRWSPPQPQA